MFRELGSVALAALVACCSQSARAADSAEPLKSDAKSKPLPALELRAALRLEHRYFDYHDSVAGPGGARPMAFELPLGPAPFLDLQLFPLDLAGIKPGALDVAVIGGYERLLATETVALEGTARETKLQTASSQYYAGLRGRLALGQHELGVRAAYGRHSFTLSDLTLAAQRGALVPSVDYAFVRLGGDVRLRFDALSFSGYLGTRLVNDTGSLGADWFPNAKTSSLEGSLSAAYAITGGVQLALGFDYLRYAFDFNPVPVSSPAIAGGATDEYISGWLGLQFVLDAPSDHSRTFQAKYRPDAPGLRSPVSR